MWATTHTVSLHGSVGHVIDVQVDLSNGMIGSFLVGRPDTAINEARDRCRAAARNSGFEWPVTKRVTILLSPADLPKRGSHFDLAIAVGVLAAADADFPEGRLDTAAMIGELTLDGRLRCVPGVLPMVMAAAARGIDTVYVPEPQVGEARMVDGVMVLGVRSLGQVMALLTGTVPPEAPPVEPLTSTPLLGWLDAAAGEDLDLCDVFGMRDARYALEVAAAGGHHLMLSGPRGSGKTTLAERLPTILPELGRHEALELTAIYSLAGALAPGDTLATRPPFRAPHHSASRTAVLGGGSGRVRPGEVSKAHHGVLLLDEFPLFPVDVIDALREPLESGLIRLSRGEEDAIFPARAIVVFGANPCPCGEFSPNNRDHNCTCGEVARRTYRRKVRGPILDRIDITRHVEPIGPHELDDTFGAPESSAAVAARVARAREVQRDR
ncbi:MAG TPA: YifB family Mg chelatase-like AAA ATPase, partial [Marmoricola sp.]